MVARLRALDGCEPGCDGRCLGACPNLIARDAAGLIEAQDAEIARLRALLDLLPHSYPLTLVPFG
jgi:hypothetical protein